MPLERLIVVSPLFTVNAPQPTRFRELVTRWSPDLGITVLAFNTGEEDIITGTGATPALMDFGIAGKALIGARLRHSNGRLRQKVSGKKGKLSPIYGLLKKIHVNRFFFPDIFIIEYRNIKRHLFDLCGRINPDLIILSTAPFTLMLLAKPLKKRFPRVKIVLDTGDPFHGDSSSYSGRLVHRLLAGKVEKHCLASSDMIVVPTEVLRNHYLSRYNGCVSESRISIIENGINTLFMNVPRGRTDRTGPLRIVYAGRFYRKLRDPSELYRAVGTFSPGDVELTVFGNIQERFKPPEDDSRFLFGGSVSAGELALKYGQADMIVYLDNARGVQVPGKVYEVLAVNRPVLYIYNDDLSPSYDLVKDLPGIFIVKNNYREIVTGIEQIMKEKPGSDYLRGSEKYTFDSLAVRYRILLERLTAGTAST